MEVEPVRGTRRGSPRASDMGGVSWSGPRDSPRSVFPKPRSALELVRADYGGDTSTSQRLVQAGRQLVG